MVRVVENLTPILDCPGQAMEVDGNLELDDLAVGALEYKLPQGIEYRIVLSNVGDAVVATGKVSADVQGECVRCLETATVHVDSEIEGYFAISESSDLEGMEDDEYEFIPESGEVDLANCIVSSVVVEIPITFLCSDDCKGLCPKCGCNRNLESCDCDDRIDDFNPFSVLKGMFGDEEQRQ